MKEEEKKAAPLVDEDVAVNEEPAWSIIRARRTHVIGALVAGVLLLAWLCWEVRRAVDVLQDIKILLGN